MKTFLLSVGALIAFSASYAQDTITSHYMGGNATWTIDSQSPVDSGYLAGNNFYGDYSKMQLFDSDYGITSGGTISSVLLGVPVNFGSGSIGVSIIADATNLDLINQTVLGSVTISLSDIDTTSANFQLVGGSTSAFYNVAATFATPVSIPTDEKFWVMVTLPGESGIIALFANDFLSFPFAGSTDHTGEIWSDESFHFMPASWGPDILLSFAIFPVVNLGASGLNENSLISSNVYPNPATDRLNINVKEKISFVNVISLDGKIVATSNNSSVDVSALSSGIYIYEALTISGKKARGKFNKI